MIRKLDFIRNVGLYRAFDWGALPEFKRFNLIYGWNYSGKTTLSRILQALERGVVPMEFVGCEFQVSHTDGAPLGTRSVLLHPKLRVFNRAFVENNFHQDMAGAKPVVVIGEENQKLKNRLLNLQARREKIVQRQIALTTEADRLTKTSSSRRATAQGSSASCLVTGFTTGVICSLQPKVYQLITQH